MTAHDQSKARYRLYLAPYSANCHGSWLLLEWLARQPGGPSFEIVEVDIANAGQTMPELISLNPRHSVPILYDAQLDEAIWESNAIIRHLVQQSKNCDDLYPEDELTQVAAIDAALEFRTDVLYPAIEDFTYVALGFSKERIPSSSLIIISALEQLCSSFLASTHTFLGGRNKPSIADFSIAPCLSLLGDGQDDDLKRLPPILRDYLGRFYEAQPWAKHIRQNVRDYVRMRVNMGCKAGSQRTFQNLSGTNDAEKLPFQRIPVSDGMKLSYGPNIEGAAVRLYAELLDHNIHNVSITHSNECGRPVLVDYEVGVSISGGHAIARHLCRKYGIEHHSPGEHGQEKVLEYSHLLRRKIEAAIRGNIRAAEFVPTTFRVFSTLLENHQPLFFGGEQPGIVDCTVYACLHAWRPTCRPACEELPAVLMAYRERVAGWRSSEKEAETLGCLAAKSELVAHQDNDQSHTLDDGDGAALRTLILKSRQEAEMREDKGPIGFAIYRKAEDKLPRSHHVWDRMAATLHKDYRNLDVRRHLDAMPLLPATKQSLPDRYLARASSLLSIFAHAYWHNEHDNPVEVLPACLVKPWEEITQRLGRSAPTMNYMDLYTYNWSGVPNSVTRMRLRTPTTGSVVEQRFYLGTVAVSHAGNPIVDLAVRAADQAERGDEEGLRKTLIQITDCIRQMTEAFEFLSLQRNNIGYVDPVLWTLTVATFAMTFTHKVGLAEAIAPSGNSLPIIHYIDSFLGRKTYDSELGQVTHSFRDASNMAPNDIKCIKYLENLRIREFVADPARSPKTQYVWNELIEVYAGPYGFLRQHLKKVFGFIFSAALVGRPSTLLKIPLSILKFTEATDNLAQLLITEIDERSSLFTDPSAAKHKAAKYPEGEQDGKPAFNELDLAFHNTLKQGLWVAIGSNVVDVTSFLWKHRGGHHILQYQAGLDATDAFNTVHPHRQIPPPWVVGVFTPLNERASQVKLMRLLTICMNVCQVEFRSIGEHMCLEDSTTTFDFRPPEKYRDEILNNEWAPYISPVNLMLLLRYFRKIYTEIFPGLLQAAEEYLGKEKIKVLEDAPELKQMGMTTRVPDRLRVTVAPEWVGGRLYSANIELIEALDEVRIITASPELGGVELQATLFNGLKRCIEPAGVVAGVYSETAESNVDVASVG